MKSREYHNTFLPLCRQLLAERNASGYWTGELAISALSTAVAIVALKLGNDRTDIEIVEDGYLWLVRNINKDGGYGDTPESVSNVSTTLICYGALCFCRPSSDSAGNLNLMEKWLSAQGIEMHAESITKSVLQFYGKDYTFSVPILSMLVICKVLSLKSLNNIPGLPFELSLLPASWYRFLNLRVVSYALPALIAVGIYHNRQRIRRIPHPRIRKQFMKAALRKLNTLMPESGGFLEATPLTAFVSMCLIKSGFGEEETVKKGLDFIRKQHKKSGGWPIDTDLSTWVTTLSVKALGEQVNVLMNQSERDKVRNHLLNLQYKTVHPFNGAKPGGWGWTSFSGSVPDADDTPGAILALLEIFTGTKEEIIAIENGCEWLVNIQNKDGGFPTFCRGWGKLPFDKSCADLTGHALYALIKATGVIENFLAPAFKLKVDNSIHMAMGYLNGNQRQDGSWMPLWFGNQHTPGKSNPVYGTAKVCIYLKDSVKGGYIDPELLTHLKKMTGKAEDFLLSQQNEDGSWGGCKGTPGTIEETALAVSALAGDYDACEKGLQWLSGREIKASPIGLYFAMLWYDEKMYPLIYYVEALRRYNECANVII